MARPNRPPRSNEPLVQRVFYRRGSAEILLLLSESGPMRFSEICRSLPEISDQTISVRLADLREIGVLDRDVDEGPPIISTYSVTELGRPLVEAASNIKAVANSGLIPVRAA